MSRLKTMIDLCMRDTGTISNRNRIQICMAAHVYGKDSSECMVRGSVDPVLCNDCPSDSKSNLSKVMECLGLKLS